MSVRYDESGKNFSTHVQYDSHYEKSHAKMWIVIFLFLAVLAYCWLYVPTFRNIITAIFS